MTEVDSQRSAVLVEAGHLRERLRDGSERVIVLHLRGSALDEVGIPGAVPVSLGDFAGLGGGTSGERPLPEIAVLQESVRRWGVSPDSYVVLYDDNGGLQAARGWWVLRWAGLPEVRLLDGGLGAWRAAGGPVGHLETRDRAGTALLSPGHLPAIDADRAAELASHGRLFDARGAAAYNAGHIPGAISLPASGNLTPTATFADPETLRQRFASFDCSADSTIAASCGSGVSAAHHILALASIGIPAALYVASWSGWIADKRRPIVSNT